MSFYKQLGTVLFNRLLFGILLVFILSTLVPSMVHGEGFSSAGFQRLCKRIFAVSPSVRVVKGDFKSLSIEGTPENTRLFAFDPPFHGLEYRTVSRAKMADYDVVTLFGREFGPDLAITLAGAQPWPNLQWEDLQVFELAFKGRRFLVITGSGSGLFQSGSYQQIRFYHIFDITHSEKINYYRVASRFGDISSFGDRNGDGLLDFIYLTGGPDDNGVYEFGFLTIGPSTVSPLRSSKGKLMRVRAHLRKNGDWIIVR